MKVCRIQKLRIGAYALTCIFAAGLSGCASSALVDVWMDPQYSAAPMQNLFVVAMQPDAAKRRLWEDAFTSAFRKQGVAATPSYQIFPDALPDTNQVIKAVGDNNYDGVLATVGLSPKTDQQYVPGYFHDSLVTGYNPWTNRYYDYFDQIYTPGYTQTETVVRHRIEVWDTRRHGGLVWTATSEVIDPTATDAVNQRNSVVDDIVDDLTKNHVVVATEGS